MTNSEVNSTYVLNKTKSWLVDILGIGRTDVDNIISSQIATVFLLVFPIMEQKVFSGFMKRDDIRSSSKKYQGLYSSMDSEYITRHFYERYQNEIYFEGLLVDPLEEQNFQYLLKKPYEALSDEEKFYLSMMTVYRYRNNIFHGNKEITRWTEFSKEIEYCIEFMMAFISAFQETNQKDIKNDHPRNRS